jgi:hypothetical protein
VPSKARAKRPGKLPAVIVNLKNDVLDNHAFKPKQRRAAAMIDREELADFISGFVGASSDEPSHVEM